MLGKIRDFFQSEFDHSPDGQLDNEKLQLAAAALLIEVAIIDNEFDGNEFAALKNILEQEFKLSGAEIDDLVTMAHSECSEATSMYQFTQLINQHYSMEEKFELVVGMWRIAFADGDLDKYEEYIIRKVSDLIHLGHGEFIRAKHAARH